MKKTREIHSDFLVHLGFKEKKLIDLYSDARAWILELYPPCNELLYYTHALTSVYSISEKLSDAFCMLPIYTNHVNFGFNKGTLISDPHGLLVGTGQLIRHIPIDEPKDYRNKKVKDLILAAIDYALKDMTKPTKSLGQTISKIGMRK